MLLSLSSMFSAIYLFFFGLLVWLVDGRQLHYLLLTGRNLEQDQALGEKRRE